jgi:2-aminoadipate transaminase
MEYDRLLAGRTARMGASAIREILKVATQPGMISMAGGIPAPESFPLEMMAPLTETVLRKHGAAALQYDTTEGFRPLRQVLAAYLGKRGVKAEASQILVSSGSQGVLDALGMVLISKGDRVAVEAPTYLGALQAFTPYEPEYVRLQTDDDGVIPDSLEAVLRQGGVKFVYLVPNFQNPTGRTIPGPRRHAIADLIRRYDTILVEDDPYGELRYRGEPQVPIQTLAPDHVVYISTLSKIFAPGLRIGFCLAPLVIRRWLVIVKQGVDLHTSTFNQALACEYIDGGYLASHLPKIIALYRPRQAAMLSALKRYLPQGFKWSSPEGGMFVWVEGPAGMDMELVYHQAVARKIAFVPGKFFYTCPGEGIETMRLNFTMFDESIIDHAIGTLSQVLAEAHFQPAPALK